MKRIEGALNEIREALETLKQAAEEERAKENDILESGMTSILMSDYENATRNRRALESVVANIESYIQYAEEHIG